MRYFRLGFILIGSVMLLECGKDDEPSGPSVPDPVASFTESGGTVTPATITFQNTSQNSDSYLWRFGDGDSTTVTNPVHVYNTHANYTVTLIAKYTETGKSDVETKLIAITPGMVFVQSIRIDEFPFTDEYGAGWDLFTGPDPYPDFVDASNNVIYTSSTYYLDVTPSDLPLQWEVDPEIRIYDWDLAYFVRLWDYDDIGDDFIGTTNGFRINAIIASRGYTPTVLIENTSGTLRAAVALRWR